MGSTYLLVPQQSFGMYYRLFWVPYRILVFPNLFCDVCDYASLCHLLPINSTISSYHVFSGLLLPHLLFFGHLSFASSDIFSFSSVFCSFSFYFLIISMVFLCLVCFLIQVDIFLLFLKVIPGIVFSIGLCVT